jgi:hypothetical protein
MRPMKRVVLRYIQERGVATIFDALVVTYQVAFGNKSGLGREVVA